MCSMRLHILQEHNMADLQEVNDAEVDEHWLRLGAIIGDGQCRDADPRPVPAPLAVEAPEGLGVAQLAQLVLGP